MLTYATVPMAISKTSESANPAAIFLPKVQLSIMSHCPYQFHHRRHSNDGAQRPCAPHGSARVLPGGAGIRTFSLAVCQGCFRHLQMRLEGLKSKPHGLRHTR